MFTGCIVKAATKFIELGLLGSRIHEPSLLSLLAGFTEINEKLASKQDGTAAIFKKSILAINIRKNSTQKRNFLCKKLWITNYKSLTKKLKFLKPVRLDTYLYLNKKNKSNSANNTSAYCFFKKLLKNVMWCKFWPKCLLFLISALNISYILYLCLVKKPVNLPTTYLANNFCNSSNKNNMHNGKLYIFQIINWFLG